MNHSGRALYISAGHPGSRNDKTIVKTDKLVMELKDKAILQDVEFKRFKVLTSIDMCVSCICTYVVPLLLFRRTVLM